MSRPSFIRTLSNFEAIPRLLRFRGSRVTRKLTACIVVGIRASDVSMKFAVNVCKVGHPNTNNCIFCFFFSLATNCGFECDLLPVNDVTNLQLGDAAFEFCEVVIEVTSSVVQDIGLLVLYGCANFLHSGKWCTRFCCNITKYFTIPANNKIIAVQK